MIEYLPLAITSIRAAKDIAANMLELRDLDKIMTATSELKSRIVEAYDYIISEKERSLSLQTRIAGLEEENKRLKQWVNEKDRYTRREIARGVFAYVQSDFEGSFQKTHKYCCNCFDKDIRSTLQQTGHKLPLLLACPNGCPPLEIYHYADE